MLLIVFSVLLAACSGEAPSGAPQEAPPASSPTHAPLENVMENIEMSLWPSDTAPQQGQKPLLSIEAKRFVGSLGSAKEWTFEGAKAVAYAQEEGDTDIHFKAAHGTFIEGKRAVLKGDDDNDVTAQLDDMTIYLKDITWEISAKNGEDAQGGMAYSNNPIRIDSPTQKLEAASMTLNPETAIIELVDVSGNFYFGEKDQ
ncbi:MAG: hypothetical protein L3K26_08905 [Candidatus Hydrogenedentes bacterium]|nr:hypothetical protein [Candidatus Hydrogenedentota bacterium]